MATKITNRERFTKIAEVIPEYADWANAQIAAMDKRNEKRKGAEKKPTKAQLESIALEPAVLEAIPAEGAQAKVIAEAVGISVQKATPILGRLVEAGKVTKTKGKGGVMIYALPEFEVEPEA